MDFELIEKALPILLLGAGVTIEITAVSVFIGFCIGLFVGIARICKVKVLRILAAIYADCIRGTPLLVQIFLIYFALPIVTGHRVEPFVAAVAACGINSGAYVSEIFRAGIQSIDKGQMEASRALGMPWGKTMRKVILPQAFRRILPPLGNNAIAIVKDSSLASAIGLADLAYAARTVSGAYATYWEPYLTISLVYWVITFLLAQLVNRLEKRFGKSDSH